MKTNLTAHLGMAFPIIHSLFGGGLSTVELVAAVSNASGFSVDTEVG